jgi:rhamnulokinase
MLPPSMPQALAEFCTRTGQPAPTEPGAVVRCALESLALKYRWTLERLEELLRKLLDTIHIVGGGSQNTFLCQLTADACNRPVVAGPVEATAIGSVLVQAIGLRQVSSLAEAREVVRQSFEVRRYEPREPLRWHGAYAKFCGFLS